MQKIALSPLTQRLLTGAGAGTFGGALIGGATADEEQGLSGALRGGAIGLGAGLLGGGGYHLLQGTPQAKQIAEQAVAQAAPKAVAQAAPKAVAQAAPKAVAQAAAPKAVGQAAAPKAVGPATVTDPSQLSTLVRPQSQVSTLVEPERLPSHLLQTLPPTLGGATLSGRTLPGRTLVEPERLPQSLLQTIAPTQKAASYKIALSPLTQRMLTGAGIGAVGGGLGGAFLSDDPDVKMDALKGALLGAGVGALGGGTYHAFAGSPAAQAAQAAPYASTLLPSEPVRAPYMESIAGGPVRAPYMESIAGGPVRAPSLASPAAPFVVGADPMAPLVVGAAPGSAKAVADMAKKATLAHYGLAEKTAMSLLAHRLLTGVGVGGGLSALGAAMEAPEGERLHSALRGGLLGGAVGAGVMGAHHLISPRVSTSALPNRLLAGAALGGLGGGIYNAATAEQGQALPAAVRGAVAGGGLGAALGAGYHAFTP